jgi:outer membrane receptor protein involved in Fe transport
MHRGPAALLGTGLLSLSLQASAQAHEEPVEVVVRVTPALEQQLQSAFSSPEASSVVDAEVVRDAAPQSLADALRGSPSVSIQQTTPGQGTIYVRGLSGRAIVYSIDGVRLNMAFFRAGNNDYLGLIDPYALTSVTIVPGAASVEYGSDALGGAVLMSTGLPRYAASSALVSYRGFQSLSSNPLSTASYLTVSREALDWGLQAGFSYYQSGPVRPGEGVLNPEPATYLWLERNPEASYQPVLNRDQIGTEFEAYAGNLTLRTRLARSLELVLRGQAFLRPELVRYDQITPRFQRDFPQRAEAGLRPLSRTMASATLRHVQTDNWYETTEASIAWQRIFEHRFQRNLREVCSMEDPEDGICQGTLRLEPAMLRTAEDNASNTFSLRVEAKKSPPNKALSLAWGLEARHDIVSSSAQSLDLPTLVQESESSRYPDGSSLSEAGLFAHSRLRVTPTFQLFAGLRGATFLLNLDERTGESPSPAFRDTLVDFAASLGTHWEFANGVAWVTNAGRGVRSPNIEDLAGLGQRAGGRFQVPNLDLGPEYSHTVDTGLKLRRANASLQAFVFYSRHEDAIALAPTLVEGQDSNETGDLFYKSVNASSVELYGFEGQSDLRLASQLRTRTRVLVMQGVQRNRAETGLPEQTPADRAPPLQGEFALIFAPLPPLEIELLVAGRAHQRRLNVPLNLDDNRIPKGGTAGYLTFHARAKIVKGMFTLRLSLENITDELVLEHGSGFYRPGIGITSSLGVDFHTVTATEYTSPTGSLPRVPGH